METGTSNSAAKPPLTVGALREKHGISRMGRAEFSSSERPNLSDKAIVELMLKITDSPESQMVDALMDLNKFVSGLKLSAADSSSALRMIWNCDVYNVFLLYMRTDFQYVKGGWDVGSTFCTLLSRLAVLLSSVLPTNDTRFFETTLYETIDRLMEAVNKVFEHMSRQTNLRDTQKVNALIENYKQILEAVYNIASAMPDTVSHVLMSGLFMNLIVGDHPQVVIATISFLYRMLVIQRGVLMRLDQEKFLCTVLDELMYHIGVSNSAEVGVAVLRCVVHMCEVHPYCIELITSRFKGIRLIVCRWFGKGFQRDLQRFIELIEAGTHERAQQDRVTRAVVKIQATWRMYAAKKRLERAGTAMSKFQKAFRNRREVIEKGKLEARIRKEFNFETDMRRKRQIRKLAEEELQQYEHFSADQVKQFVNNRKQNAAKLIQTRFRGFKERARFSTDKQQLKQWKAAVVLQRAVRKWLDHLHYKRNEPPAYQRPPGLTETRREEIQKEILDWRSTHQPKTRTYDELREFHGDTQQTCFMFLAGSKQRRRKEQEYEATVRRLEADTNLLMSAPKVADLEKLVGPELDSLVLKYQSRVLPVATRARQLHSEQLKRLQAPTWQQLCVDPDKDELDMLGELTREERKMTQISEINLL